VLHRGGRIDHVGIVVDDLDEAVVFFRDVLGLQEGDHVDRPNLRTVFFSAGSAEIEAIEIIDPEQRAARLGDGETARIDHVAIEVSKLDQVLQTLEERGVLPKAPPQQAERYRAFWTVPETADGVSYQFVERATSQDVHVLRPVELETVDRGGGVRTVHLCTAERGAKGFANGFTAIEPGSAVPFHFHNCEESVLILEGEAVFELEGSAETMATGELTLVPAGVPHRFVNPGPGLLRMFFTYGTAAATRTMVESGETAPIGSERDRLGL
jgi:quercetin dioxygenase-like cupin family protein